MRLPPLYSGLTAFGLAVAGSLAALSAPAPALPQQALGVLQRRCFQCHGGSKISGLDLRTRDAALKGGAHGPALNPGKPEESPLYLAISGRSKLKMPPAGTVPSAEQDVLKQWIQSGAAWPEGSASGAEVWWSLRPLQRPPQPRVRDAGWVRNPVDAFILARLEEKGLKPAPPAGRRELIRRVYFDLTGLPPTPEEVDAFVADRSPDAYEKLVDRLLASPHYGERWARHWLDVARFAESQGFERDKVRDHAWRYRDYVIRSLNEDKPYDRFVREQIAGDVLPDATRETTVATGFLVAGPWDEVGNQQASMAMKRRVREDELEDMVSAVGQTFLGLTVNCARCHDHKFDPIPTRDYYRIQAALAGVRHGDRDIRTAAERAERDREKKGVDEKLARLQGELDDLDRRARERLASRAAESGAPAPLARWGFEKGGEDSLGGLELKTAGGAAISGGRLKLDGKSALARSGPLPFTLTEKTLEAWVSLRDLDQRGGGVVTVQDPKGDVFDSIVFGERQPKKWTAGSEFFRRTKDLERPDETAAPGDLVHVAITYARDGRIALYRDGQPYGEGYTPTGEGAGLRTFEAGKAQVVLGLRHGEGAAAGDGRWLKGEIEEARLYGKALTPEQVLASFKSGPAVSEAQVRSALNPAEQARRAALAEQAAAARKELERITAPVLCYAANPQKPPEVHILARGDINQPGTLVAAGGLSCVPGLEADFGLRPDAPEEQRRLKLAEWLTSPGNPLTPRVIVNRVWQFHFGRGLAASASDFGVNGEPPTHPELLDYLASVFSSGAEGGMGWRLKSLHRLILLSNTYRQSDRFDAKAAAVDADDRLLWRMPPKRLEAEEIRDAMLCVSGQLNPEAGGPGYRPFTVVHNNSDFYTVEDRIGPEYNRRSIYRTVVNSAGIPLLETFDCPDPSVKTPRRAATTTPLQALTLLNNSFSLRQARELAARVQREAGGFIPAQGERAYRLVLGRAPEPEEKRRAVLFTGNNGLPAFCRVLFNSSEFVYVR